MRNGVYFIVRALLVAKLLKILIYANYRTCGITMWAQSDVKKKTKYGISVQILSQQGWNFAGLMCGKLTTHCDGGYDVTPVLYFA